MRIVERIAAIVVLAVVSGIAAAQSWPTRPLRIIVAFPPGGVVDATSRLLARELTSGLGQQVVVENRPGAGSLMGTEYAAKAAPDGYTFYTGASSALAINPHIYKANYNPLRDFAPITLLGKSTIMLAINPSLEAKSARELVSLAAKRPDEFNYGSAGIGSTYHIAVALFLAVTNSKMTHIPNKGSQEALTDLIAGRTQVQADAVHVFMPQIGVGKVRPIGIMGATRSPLAPDVSTLGEQGFKGLDLSGGTGFVAPLGTPDAILDRMHEVLVKVLGIPEVRENFGKLGIDLGDHILSRKEHAAYMAEQYAFWGNAVKTAGVKID